MAITNGPDTLLTEPERGLRIFSKIPQMGVTKAEVLAADELYLASCPPSFHRYLEHGWDTGSLTPGPEA